MVKLTATTILCLLSLAACLVSITFAEISQPYLDAYGEPDEMRREGSSSDFIVYWEWHYDTFTYEVSFWRFGGVWEVRYENRIYTFANVSQPYLNEYGTPEEVGEFISGNYHLIDWYHTIDWWWWCPIGFVVRFINSSYDDVSGWAVDSTNNFAPICF